MEKKYNVVWARKGCSTEHWSNVNEEQVEGIIHHILGFLKWNDTILFEVKLITEE